MIKRIKSSFIGILIVLTLTSCVHQKIVDEDNEIKEVISIESTIDYFEGYNGCFVIYDEQSDIYQVINESRMNVRLSPLSTFKIPLSLIGLESGVIEGKYHKYEWNGHNYHYESWNQDHTLESAISNSVVWYYKELATNVGESAMKEYIDLLEYGNMDISGGLTEFWLFSPALKISPKEQVDFLRSLYNNELSFSNENMMIVRDIMKLEEKDNYILSGKTGTYENEIGWFVGVAEYEDNTYYFATSILGDDNANGQNAKEITLEILEDICPYYSN